MYILELTANISWVGDGIGNYASKQAQTLQVAISDNQSLPGFVSSAILVPGGDAPSGGNLTTAATSAGTALGVLLNANLAQIQGFATGGA